MVSLLSTVRDIERLRQIGLVLARHGFGEVVDRTGLAKLLRREGTPTADLTSAPEDTSTGTVGARIRRVLQDLGPSFVKLGQILSTRSDLIPEEVIRELERLQDQAGRVEVELVKKQIEGELGAPVEELYERFDDAPLASASIAQVHRARCDGAEVVVKVQRPGIRSIVERDIELLHLIARALERSVPESRVYSPVGLVTEFDRAMTAELDFNREAENAARFARAFEGRTEVRFPRVDRERSSRRVLTMEYLDGKKPHAAIEAGIDGPRLARLALRVIFEQVFDHGFFHGDPHPGNLLVMGTPDAPVLAMLDLGLVGRLSPQLRDKTVDLMMAAVRRDTPAIAEALYAIGTPTRRIDRGRFEAEVEVLADRYLGKRLEEIELAALIGDLIGGATRYGLEIPPEFLMLGRALMTVEGVGKELDPDLDVLSELEPLFVRLLRQRYSPERLASELIRSLGRFGASAQTLPQRLDQLLDDLRAGRLELAARAPDLVAAGDRVGRRVFAGLVIAALVVGGSQLVASGHDTLGSLLFAGAAGWAALSILRK